MILALTLGIALLQQDPIFIGSKTIDISGRLNDGTGAYWIHGGPSDDPHLTPQKFGTPPKQAEFYYHTDAYVFEDGNKDAAKLRFRIFSQTPTRNMEMGKPVAIELLVLWRMNHDKLRIDHNEDINKKVVDVYLFEGIPAGEDAGGYQQFETVNEDDGTKRYNSIYIFDAAHFDDHMEQAREVAHEYGHAVLTPIGGFDKTDHSEYWANGNLGEKLYLRWGLEAIKNKKLQEWDFMSTPEVRMDYWVKRNVNPLVEAAAQRPPDSPLLSGTDAAAFDAFQGIALWCDTFMPAKMFARSLKVIGSIHAKDYAQGAVLAAEEMTYSPRIPDSLRR